MPRTIPIITIAVTLICNLLTASESGTISLQTTGSITLSNAQVHTYISVDKGTNALPIVTVTWTPSHSADPLVKPMTRAGWFVVADTPARVWVFDGESLSLLEHRPTALIDSSNPEAFKNCPAIVRLGLPEEVRKRYFK